MIGECFGNVRSTPTPKLTLRTVNVSRTPLPLIRITTPWNTCTRSRVPSTTRTWTFNVSPGPKSGMSLRRWARSTRSVAFIGIPPGFTGQGFTGQGFTGKDSPARRPFGHCLRPAAHAGVRFEQPPILLVVAERLLVAGEPLLV